MAESEIAGETDSGRLSDALLEAGPLNLLVSGPPLLGKTAFVVDVVEAARDADRDALLVTTTHGADRLLESVEGVDVVDCTPTDVDDERVNNVSSPGDLTGISMPVSEFLAGSTRPVVGFDSVSALLMYAGKENVFRFLSVLTTHVANRDGLGLFPIDTGSHEAETARTFDQLFDGHVEFRDGADGRQIRAMGIDPVSEGWYNY